MFRPRKAAEPADEPAETLAGVGEFAVIDRLVTGRDQPATVMLGPGDDAAVVVAGDGRTVVSTDMLVAGRHFRLDWSTPHDVGRKAIAQNAADIEAMGAQATAFVVAFGAPADTASQVLELADGLWHEARLFGASVGDLVSAPQWVISVTVLGDLAVASRCAAAARSQATPWRSPESWADLQLDMRCGTAVFASSMCCAVGTWCEPPYGQGRVAAEAGATAMTDVSDGLVADLGHIATASGVGIDLSTAALPPTVTPWPRLPRRWEPTRGHGCSAVARTTRWSPRSPVAAGRLASDRPSARRTAARLGGRRRGAEIRVGSRSDRRAR